jgi:transposase
MEKGTTVIGMDVSDKLSYLCVVDGSGEVLGEDRIRTTPDSLRRWFGKRSARRVVLEVGAHSPWIDDLLRQIGHEVCVADPRTTRMIFESDRKTDRHDALQLARLGLLHPDLVRPVVHRSRATRAALAVLRARAALVEVRSGLVNHVRGSVKPWGVRLPACSTSIFPRRAADLLPPEIAEALRPLLEQIGEISERIEAYDDQVEQMAQEQYPDTKILRRVPGVGPVTALTYVLTLERPERFRHSRAVGSYVGVTARQDQSGDVRKQLRITKAGDRTLRTLLVQCAHHILGRYGPDCDMKRWGLALCQRGGKASKKRAIVAVARRLAVLLHALWKTRGVYDPFRLARERGEKIPA